MVLWLDIILIVLFSLSIVCVVMDLLVFFSFVCTSVFCSIRLLLYVCICELCIRFLCCCLCGSLFPALVVFLSSRVRCLFFFLY